MTRLLFDSAETSADGTYFSDHGRMTVGNMRLTRLLGRAGRANGVKRCAERDRGAQGRRPNSRPVDDDRELRRPLRIHIDTGSSVEFTLAQGHRSRDYRCNVFWILPAIGLAGLERRQQTRPMKVEGAIL